MQSSSRSPGRVCAEWALDVFGKEGTVVCQVAPCVRGSGPHPQDPFPEPMLHLQRGADFETELCFLGPCKSRRCTGYLFEVSGYSESFRDPRL